MRVNRVINYVNEVIHKPTCCGDRLIETFKLSFNDDGTKELVVDGHKDIYAEIQSHADSCDVKAIIKRCTITGDTSELYKNPGFYGDIINMPNTYADVLKAAQEANNIWNKLPANVKEKFDNDVSKFYASAFTKDWMDKLGIEFEEPSIKPIDPIDIKESENVNE